MREKTLADNRTKPSRPNEHNQQSRANPKTNGIPPKPKYSLWGAHIVKGFTTEKKTKQPTTINCKDQPIACAEVLSQKIQYEPYSSRVKRSLVGDFPCPITTAQIHPHAFECNQVASPASRDVFLELDRLRELLRESKERELQLRSEFQLYKENPRVLELDRDIDTKKAEIDKLISRVSCLEAENQILSEQLGSISEEFESTSDQNIGSAYLSYRDLELEVVELRRVNKELLFQKRNLSLRLSSAESELAALARITESDIVTKVQAEASLLRHTNENLSKQVEGLQMSRLNEVEEVAYLRWVNSCLRHELSSSDKAADCNDECSCDRNNGGTEINIGKQALPCCKMSLPKGLVKWPENNEGYQTMLDIRWADAEEDSSPRRRHSIGGSKENMENLTTSRRRQSDCYLDHIEANNESIADKHHLLAHEHDTIVAKTPKFFENKLEHCNFASLDVEKRTKRAPNPPPRPSISSCDETKEKKSASVPPPPPPPPPLPKSSARSTGLMLRAPQVAELYHSLMKRDLKKDSSSGGICDATNAANVHSSMIGEIENRSSHLMAIKADIETQGEFVKSLIKEVNDAVYSDIEDVVAFVKWLDDELCFLVDERAVLKHFDWPEKKADTLREAAFGYIDLKKLECEVSMYEDNLRLQCDVALKKMVALSEKMERSIYNILRTRDLMLRRFKDFQIPTGWMLDSGIISKIKFGSVKLAKMYMKRVTNELNLTGVSKKDPALEYMLLQGVRFAFRIHQFAGGFDAETMKVFEELQNVAYVRNTV